MEGIVFAAVLTLLNGLRDSLPFLLAALLHESGHLLACRLLRVPIRFVRTTVTGAVIGYDPSSLSYAREIWIAAAGPLMNLAGFLVCLPGECSRSRALFGAACLSLSLFNLLPIRRLDGGVITNNLLVSLLGPIQGIRIGGILSRICTVGLWMCAAAVQIRCGGNLSLFFISVCLLTKIAGG